MVGTGFGRPQAHYTASTAKALTGGMSLLVALSDGRIAAADPASKYIPAWRNDPLKSKITGLTMTLVFSGARTGQVSSDAFCTRTIRLERLGR